MLLLAYELTNRCDIACLHCLRDKNDPRQDLKRDFFLRTLDEAQKLGVGVVSFTGGEPTLHADYLFFVDEVAKRGLKWITVTNGHNLDLYRDVFADGGRRQALDLLAISLDGATEEVHDKIRGKGSFRKIMKTVAYLSTLNVKVRFQMTLTKANLHEMEDFVVLAASLGVKEAFFGYLQATKKNVLSDLLMLPDDYRRAQVKIGQLATMFTIRVGHTFGYFDPSPMLKCTVLHGNSMNIDYLGNMIFCCQLSNFGDVTYVPDRQEVLCDLNKISLLDGYKILLQRIADYSKEKAERVAAGKVKGLDLFPCYYCAKKFGKMDWLGDADVAHNENLKKWADAERELSKVLLETDFPVAKSLSPNH